MKNLIILGFFGFFSCKSMENRLLGKYNRHWDFENHSSLHLDKDNTFLFKGQEGLVWLNTTGKWKTERNNLILNSYPDTVINVSTILLDEKSVRNDSILILVLDNVGEPLPGANVVVYNGTDTVAIDYTRMEGQIAFKKVEFDSIQISFIGFNSFAYTGAGNSIKIKLGLSQLTFFGFEHEKWKIRGNKLLDPRFIGDQRKNKYKKIK